MGEFENFTKLEINFYIINQTVLCALAISSMLLNLLVCIVVSKTKSMHLNVRILTFGIGLSCFTGSGQHFVRMIYALVQLNEYGVSGWEMLYSDCILSEIPSKAGSCGYLAFPLALAIERAYATAHHQTYDEKKPIWGVTATVIIVVASLLQIFQSFYVGSNISPANQTIVYCDAVQQLKIFSDSPWILIISLAVVIVFCCSPVIGLTLWTYRKSKLLLTTYGINQSRLSLVSKLQLRHSIFITKMLIPVVLAQQFGLLSAIIAAVVVKFGLNLSLSEEIIYDQLGLNGPTLVSGNLIPLICLIKNNVLYTETTKIFNISRCDKSVAIVKPIGKQSQSSRNYLDEQDQHFQALESIWLQKKQKLAWVL